MQKFFQELPQSFLLKILLFCRKGKTFNSINKKIFLIIYIYFPYGGKDLYSSFKWNPCMKANFYRCYIITLILFISIILSLYNLNLLLTFILHMIFFTLLHIH